MKIKLPGMVAVFCFGIYSFCSIQKRDGDKNVLKNKNDTDTLIKDIPLDKKGEPRSYYKNKKGVENMLGLTTLENGFDSLQIRIWYGYAFNDTSQLIILKNTKGSWRGDFFTLVYNLNERGDSIISINKLVESKNPKNKWETVIRKMVTLNILTLPDYHLIPDYAQSADGNSVIVEIALKNRYRLYSYQEPGMHKNKYSQAKDMEQILNLVVNEFGFIPLRNL